MIENDVQKLEPGSRVVLYELDLTPLDGPVLRFHGHLQGQSIWWQGEEYEPWALEATGFEKTGEGQQPSPTLRVGNIGMDANGNQVTGVISALCIQFDDMVGARLVRHQTFSRYLDARNFPDGNPGADPDQHFPDEIWLIDQKTSEDKETVEFALTTALDFDGQQLPGRQIIANVCAWLTKDGYCGEECQYTGSRMYDINDNPVTDPVQDRCSGRLSVCKKRFGDEPARYGSFPSADTTRGY